MLYKNTKAMDRSSDGDTDFFDIIAHTKIDQEKRINKQK